MLRRSFLSSIPALASLPFFGKFTAAENPENLPVLQFDEHGKIVNIEELMKRAFA